MLVHRLSLIVLVLTATNSLIAVPQADGQSKPRSPLSAVQERHRDEFQKYSDGITKLVSFCEERKLDEAIEVLKPKLERPNLQNVRGTILPTEVQPELPAQLPADERTWKSQLRRLDKDYAQNLYLASRQALRAGHPSHAYLLVREAAQHDPDHPSVRKILGYVRQGNEWMTPFAAEQTRLGNVRHEEYGWLPKSHLEQYSKGKRNFKGRWISAEKEAELRRDFNEGWIVQTDHYKIKTNVSLEAGVELGKSLETFFENFDETFASFFNSPEQMQKLFEGTDRTTRTKGRAYLVNFYRTRDEYVDRLIKRMPAIEKTNGVYTIDDLTVHFYLDQETNNEATLFHEATHQIFYESSKPRPIGDEAHFWIVEGIACYMESFEYKNGNVSLGNPNYTRFIGARDLLLNKQYHVPLRELSLLGMRNFQRRETLAKDYSQSAGLARFFMHYDDGRYREVLIEHLSQIYSADERKRVRALSLDLLTGVDFEELDRQYVEDSKQLGTPRVVQRDGRSALTEELKKSHSEK